MGVETDGPRRRTDTSVQWAPGMFQLMVEYSAYDNQYTPFMEAARVNRGWVFDLAWTMELVHEYGINSPVMYVLKPRDSFWDRDAHSARRQFIQMKQLYGQKTLMIMVADVDSSNQWNVGPLRPAELWMAPQVLIRLRQEAKQKSNAERSEMLNRTQFVQKYMGI